MLGNGGGIGGRHHRLRRTLAVFVAEHPTPSSNPTTNTTLYPPTVYLKTSGVDPSNHPVMQELVRHSPTPSPSSAPSLTLFATPDPPQGLLRQAPLGRILRSRRLHLRLPRRPRHPHSRWPFVLSPSPPPSLPLSPFPLPPLTPPSLPPPARFTIDKSAATRFINAAISSSKAKTDPFYTPAPAELTEAPEASEAPLPPSVHTRFDDAASKLLESSGEEDGEEEVMEVMEVGKGKGKGRAEGGKGEEGEDEEMEELRVEKLPRKKAASATGKAEGKRAKMDPFAGVPFPPFYFLLPSIVRGGAGSRWKLIPRRFGQGTTRSRVRRQRAPRRKPPTPPPERSANTSARSSRSRRPRRTGLAPRLESPLSAPPPPLLPPSSLHFPGGYLYCNTYVRDMG